MEHIRTILKKVVDKRCVFLYTYVYMSKMPLSDPEERLAASIRWEGTSLRRSFSGEGQASSDVQVRCWQLRGVPEGV